ncbi:MAG: helix-turn-helix domain-containing protein [Thermodesulfovibrionales bacterium]
MSAVSSGIRDLDRLIDSIYVGDNVIWEVEAGTLSEAFINRFIRQSADEGQNVIYVNFNRSPQNMLQHLGRLPSKGFTLLDCFTSGKGKSDRAFLRFYEGRPPRNVVRVERPGDIDHFTNILNELEDGLPRGARYVFDSLTGMQDLWGDEQGTYKFFTYMCPRLYDLGTVAYWLLEKEAHTQSFKANLRHITQVVLELYKRKESLHIKAHKLDGRTGREAFKPHSYTVEDGNVFISQPRREAAFNIGTRVKALRLKLGMNQKELASRVGLTPSFISQMENNQISPSLNSFIQICNALGVSPDQLWKDLAPPEPVPWLIRREKMLSSVSSQENGIKGFRIAQNGTASGTVFVMEPGAVINRHLTSHRGKEIIHVLRGSVTVVVEGREEKLIAGDSVFLRDEQPAEWRNEGGDKAELLVVCL